MKKKMPSEGLRLGRDSGSIICDTLKKWRFRTGWGGNSCCPIRKLMAIGRCCVSIFHSHHRIQNDSAFTRCQTMAQAEGLVCLLYP